jgi:hypothetical protein
MTIIHRLYVISDAEWQYGDYGLQTCAGDPGSWDHEDSDAQTFFNASSYLCDRVFMESYSKYFIQDWDFDFLK